MKPSSEIFIISLEKILQFLFENANYSKNHFFHFNIAKIFLRIQLLLTNKH